MFHHITNMNFNKHYFLSNSCILKGDCDVGAFCNKNVWYQKRSYLAIEINKKNPCVKSQSFHK